MRSARRRCARERARLRPALRAAAAAVALSVRRGGGGCALVRRVRAVRAPRECAARLRANRSARQPDRADDRASRCRSGRSGSPCSACSSSRSSPACSATPTPTATSPRPWCGSSGGWASPTCGVRSATSGRSINPWRTVFDAAEWLYRRLGGTKRARLAAALPASAGSLAGLHSPAGLLLDRARLSQRGRAGAHRLAGDRLLGPDLGRHARIRPRRLAAARRGVLAGVRHLRPLRADRGQGRPAAAAAARRGAARRSPGVDVDDGLRAAAAGDRALRRADRHRRMGGAGKRAALPPAGSGRNERHGDQNRRPRRLLGAVPRRLSRHMRGHELGGVRPPRAARDRAQLRPDAGPDRHRLSRGALPGVPAGAGAIHHPAPLRPVRLLAGTCSAPPAIASTSPSPARALPGTRPSRPSSPAT